MANHKSAEKRARQTIKKNALNRSRSSIVTTVVKKVRTAITEGNKAEAQKLLPEAQKLINRLAKTGVIKKETASRKTSRLASQVQKL
ncbi:MAG: 30S ribosomal protein S20 [Bdellovibrio sp. CG12_big_fil_rev_8_21_14_0_65_39_13]|nr:MAG: 30S ribosomal protein S20 [Bdellovibrio sp. CG22_combo_CG10-13_8_21_14_all_39_27]PIQ59772.1 MAG: 30S ribosomal protein S20 [Bdellovibrio sp. CG12_big_fil_rev_8_21_14_0_65_39_13]PIR36200.1 MAG: 30S ribosomal protein S20 [Bdellovibrio sp. CG11_big_fil_rev_8_21_14_0_20_39_38]PJB52478.1 MAG: 30S ribosomal protein S20 [Bdellovibrio sp. CG_4_9_14_3_um_filter_39_7]